MSSFIAIQEFFLNLAFIECITSWAIKTLSWIALLGMNPLWYGSMSVPRKGLSLLTKFSYDLVQHIAQADRFKVIGCLWFFLFWG